MFIDISYPYYEGMAIYPGNPGFSMEDYYNISKGDSCNISEIRMGTHTGTHIDAPTHFIQNGKSVDRIPLEVMNGKTKVLDFTGIADIDTDNLRQSINEPDSIILFKTDNSSHFKDKNVLDEFVTLTYEAADYLAEIGIRMIGIDYMTVERPRTKREAGKSVHNSLLKNDIVILESINLEGVDEGQYILHCFPLSIVGADGSPVRAVLEML